MKERIGREETTRIRTGQLSPRKSHPLTFIGEMSLFRLGKRFNYSLRQTPIFGHMILRMS